MKLRSLHLSDKHLMARDLRFNVLLTPHTAAGSVLAYSQMRAEDYGNLLRLLRGEPLLHRIV